MKEGRAADAQPWLDKLVKAQPASVWRATAEALVHRKAPRDGSARVQQLMRQQGVPADLIAASMAELQGSELARAREVWQRKFGERPDSPQARAKQMRFMVSRGFSPQLLDRLWRDDEA